jgi:hypothetical protein
MIIMFPIAQSAVDLDIHAESQQLIRKQPVSKVDTAKVDKHLLPPSQGSPATPETLTSSVPLPDPPSRQRTTTLSSISAWPHPPTSIPPSPSPSPTLASSPTSTLKGDNRDSYIDHVRQPSPAFATMTVGMPVNTDDLSVSDKRPILGNTGGDVC